MLQLYNKNHVKLEGLTKYKDYKIESILSTADKVLSFSYPKKYSDKIEEEGYIRTKTAEFVIKEIGDAVDWITVKATLNVEGLEGQPWDRFDSTEQTITACLNLAIAGTGWSVGTCSATKLRTVRKTGCSAWDIVQEAVKTYRAEAEFDTLNKAINIYDKLGSDKGCYFIDSLNLKALTIQRNSYDYYTRIQAVGKDRLTLPAPGYVENYQYSNKIKTLYWKDERYTDVESLTEDSSLKLDELSKPYRAYGADIIDLANSSPKYKNILSYGLGDTITLISKDMKVKEKQRIAKIIEYPEEPEKNTCELANVILSFEDVQKENQNTTDTVNNITEDDGTVSRTAISTAVNNLTAQQFSAVTGRIGTLETTTAHITNGIIDNATIDIGKVNNLSSTYATIVNLEASKARITTLEATTADINTLLAGNIGADNLAAGAIQAGSAVIANGAISSAQIINLKVVQLEAGDISTTKFRIVSDSGNMLMSDNTIQISDATRVRVQIGKDASADYNMYVWDASGNLMFDATGLKASGIKSKIIRDDMVSDTANINAAKIDINSMFSQMNANGTSTLKGSKIYLDTQAQTLQAAFTSLSSTVTSQGTTISSQGTSITAIQGQISSKIWSTDITTAVNNIQIGGRNYYKTTTPITSLNGEPFDKTQGECVNGFFTVGIRTGNQGIKLGEVIVCNGYWTVSFEWRGSQSLNVGATLDICGLGSQHINVTADNSWSKVSITVNVTNYSSGVNDFVHLIVDWANFYLRNIKIEQGTKATDWTPAPEDVQGQIDATNTNITTNYSTTTQTNSLISAQVASVSTDLANNYSTTTAMNSAISQSASGVLTTVSQTYATQTAVNGKSKVFTSQPVPPYSIGDLWINTAADGNNYVCTTARASGSYTASDWTKDSIAQRVSSAEQKITADAIVSTVRSSTAYTGDLNGKVGTSEIISRINQTAESIQISAEKINLTGYVTMTNLSTSGQTSIDGGNIKTTSIAVNKLASDVGSSLDISSNVSITNKVSTNDIGTLITQNADSVKIAVGQIGGNNLLKHTDFSDVEASQTPSGWWYWGNASTYWQQGSGSYVLEGTIYIVNTTTSAGGLWQGHVPLKSNTKYTLSLSALKEENVIDALFVVEYKDSNNNVINAQNLWFDFDGIRHGYTFTTLDILYDHIDVGFKHGGSSSSDGSFLVKITYPKLEEGENATAWSQNYNELKSNIVEINDSHLRATFSDGSYSEMVPEGFHHVDAGGTHDYHYLTFTGLYSTSLIYNGDTSYFSVQLPSEFINKDFHGVLSISYFSGEIIPSAVKTIYCTIDSYDKANAKMNCHCSGRAYTQNSSGWLSQSCGIWMDISYVVFA